MEFMLMMMGIAATIYAVTRNKTQSPTGAAYIPQAPNESSAATWAALTNSFGANMGTSDAGTMPIFGARNWKPSSAARPYLDTVLSIEEKYGLPRGLLARLIEKESAWNPTARNARSGAYGLAQFMPATAAEFGVTLDGSPWDDIDGAARYLVWLKKYLGGWAFAVGGYNWGPGNVKNKGLWNAPAETRDYIEKISGDILGIGYAQAAALHQQVIA